MADLFAGGILFITFLDEYIRLRNLAPADGASQYIADFPSATVRCLAVNGNGDVFVGGATSSVAKYSRNFTQSWSRNYTNSNNYGIAVDSNENVYVAGGALRKFNSSGTQQWSQGSGISCVALSSTGYIAAAGSQVGSAPNQTTTYLYDSNGNLQWSADHGGTVNAIACDTSGNVYTSGNRTGSSPDFVTTRKYNSSGTQQWTANHNAATWACIVGPDGYLYIAGDAVSSNTVRQYTLSGTENWARAYNGSSTVNALAVDSSGNVYTGGASTSSAHIRKYNSSGTQQWAVNHGATIYALALTSDPITTDVPGLQVGITLGTPASGFITFCPDLAIPVNLGIPTSVTAIPPDVQPSFYVLYVTGGELLRLPLQSIQCSRRYSESTWLVVEVQGAAGLRGVLETRKSAGGRLSIFAGILLPDGTEQTGEFLQAALTEIREEKTSMKWTLTLTGRVIPTPFTQQTRQLRQVSERGFDNSGKRFASCAVDPLLRPNDWANDGLNLWKVGNITFRIDFHTARMRVVSQ